MYNLNNSTTSPPLVFLVWRPTHRDVCVCRAGESEREGIRSVSGGGVGGSEAGQDIQDNTKRDTSVYLPVCTHHNSWSRLVFAGLYVSEPQLVVIVHGGAESSRWIVLDLKLFQED